MITDGKDGIHGKGRGRSSSQVPPAIETIGVGPQKPLHPGAQVCRWRFDNPIEVIGQETERVNLPTRHAASFSQSIHMRPQPAAPRRAAGIHTERSSNVATSDLEYRKWVPVLRSWDGQNGCPAGNPNIIASFTGSSLGQPRPRGKVRRTERLRFCPLLVGLTRAH